MVLIQIDSLSLTELRCIAEQEGIDGIESLSREELIDLLQEFYEDDSDDNQSEENLSRRFVSSLTDYRGDEAQVNSLPGVEKLPTLYPETSIHALSKNSTWVYCYWSLSPLDMEKFNEKYGDWNLVLVISMDGDSQYSFDISVGKDDTDWNINVPRMNGALSIALVLQAGDERVKLATSETIPLVSLWWLDHASEAVGKEDLVKRYLCLLTSRDGQFTSCLAVHDILDNIKKEEGLK